MAFMVGLGVVDGWRGRKYTMWWVGRASGGGRIQGRGWWEGAAGRVGSYHGGVNFAKLEVRNAELCIESSSTTPTHTGLNDVPRALSPPLPSIDGYPRQVPPGVVAHHGHSGMHTLTCSTFLFLCGILPRTVGGAGSCGATFG